VRAQSVRIELNSPEIARFLRGREVKAMVGAAAERVSDKANLDASGYPISEADAEQTPDYKSYVRDGKERASGIAASKSWRGWRMEQEHQLLLRALNEAR
jgi:hypothetical protein